MLAMKRIPLVLFVMIALGCAPAVQSGQPVSPSRSLKSSKDIRLFADRLPQCRYEMLGRVESRRQGGMSLEATVNSFRRQARDRGGDAIIRVEWREDTRSPTSARAMRYYSNRSMLTGESFDERTVSGIVIRFLDPSCRR
jgi:hypothetical protein